MIVIKSEILSPLGGHFIAEKECLSSQRITVIFPGQKLTKRVFTPKQGELESPGLMRIKCPSIQRHRKMQVLKPGRACEWRSM